MTDQRISPYDLALKYAQDCISALPVIVLGSGASIPYGMASMDGIRQELMRIDVSALSPEDQGQWHVFKLELNTSDLEAALTKINLSENLTDMVVMKTWELLAPQDFNVFLQLLKDRQCLPLSKLLKHLLSSTHQEIDVVTTNYDRLAEYAAEAVDLSTFTGFGYGYLRNRHRDATCRVHQSGRPCRTVKIWKVHGSLDWFKDQDDVVISVPTSVSIEGLSPVIVTPGIDKYRRTHDEPFRSVLSGADTALIGARSYLCIGYGFNDEHIQPKLVERCRRDEASIVIITKKLTEQARLFLSSNKCSRYLALEETSGGTNMISSEYPDGVLLPKVDLWRLDLFLSMIM